MNETTLAWLPRQVDNKDEDILGDDKTYLGTGR